MQDLKSGIEHLKQAKAHMSKANGIMSNCISKLKSLEEENAQLRAELNDWRGNAEGFEPDAYMKLPLDADGVPIRLGDTVWYIGIDVDIEKDCPMKVNGFVRVPFTLETFIETLECPRKAIATESLTHKRPESPDSWEKLEEDARKSSCDYASAPLDENGFTTCDGCRFQNGGPCHLEKDIDLMERAKKLAGIEKLEGEER